MASTPREKAALVREFLTRIVAGDIDALGIFLTDDSVEHQPALDDRVCVDTASSEFWCMLAVADADIAIDNGVVADDTVAVRGTITGIHREWLLDPVSIGRSFETVFARFWRCENGRIMEVWSLSDGPGFMQQLDDIPEKPEVSITTPAQ